MACRAPRTGCCSPSTHGPRSATCAFRGEAGVPARSVRPPQVGLTTCPASESTVRPAPTGRGSPPASTISCGWPCRHPQLAGRAARARRAHHRPCTGRRPQSSRPRHRRLTAAALALITTAREALLVTPRPVRQGTRPSARDHLITARSRLRGGPRRGAMGCAVRWRPPALTGRVPTAVGGRSARRRLHPRRSVPTPPGTPRPGRPDPAVRGSTVPPRGGAWRPPSRGRRTGCG
jgi:hypothetical protein